MIPSGRIGNIHHPDEPSPTPYVGPPVGGEIKLNFVIQKMDTKTLVECDDCGAVIPLIVRETGELSPVGTGGTCRSGTHSFTGPSKIILDSIRNTPEHTNIR